MARNHTKQPSSCAFRPLPLLLVALTTAALALSTIAYRSSSPWFEQHVGYGVGVAGLSAGVGSMDLKVTVREWCLEGFPDTGGLLDVPEINTASANPCKPIDMCAISDDVCLVMRVVKDVALASIALIAVSLLMSLLLFFNHRVCTPCTYLFLFLTSLLALVADVALLLFFRRLKHLIPPQIPNIVSSISKEAAQFITTSDQGNNYGKPHTFLEVAAGLMAATLLASLLSACFERCGRRVRSRSFSAKGGQPMSTSHETVRV